MPIYKFYLPDVSCSACTTPIEEDLRACIDYTIHCGTDLSTKILTVNIQHNLTDDEAKAFLRERIAGVGFEALPWPEFELAYEPVPERVASLDTTLRPWKRRLISGWKTLRKIIQSHWTQGAIGLTLGCVLMIISLTTGGLPLAAMISIGVISTVMTLLLGAPTYYRAIHTLIKSRTLSMDLLFSISTLTILAVSLLSFGFPWLPMMFDAGLLIFGFHHIGLGINESVSEGLGLHKTLQDTLPEQVMVLIDDRRELCLLKEVEVGACVEVNQGDIIPLDGIAQCDGWVDVSSETGSCSPRYIQRGEPVLAGMKPYAPFSITVSQKTENSYFARLDKSIHNNTFAAKIAPTAKASNKILKVFIPTVIGISIVCAVIIGIFFPPSLAIQCAVAILVSACPCVLGMIVPLFFKVGMHKAARAQVVFKSPDALEHAAFIDTVVFDLTGTLTEGALFVSETSLDEESLAIVAAIERESRHPFAEALCRYIGDKKITDTIDNIELNHHSGIKARVNGVEWAIGNETLMQTLGIEVLVQCPEQAHILYVVADGKLLGHFIVADKLRADARSTVELLKKQGIQVFICTGENEKTAYLYASLLGIEQTQVWADCTSTAEGRGGHDKESLINQLKQQGATPAFIGDGVNDAPVSALCLSMAMLSPTADEATQHAAQATIQSHSLMPIVNGLIIARQLVTHVRRSLVFSLIFNIVAMLLPFVLITVFSFAINPVVGVILMMAQSLLILGYVYAFKQKQIQQSENPEIQNAQQKALAQMGCENAPEVQLEPAPRHVELFKPVAADEHQQVKSCLTFHLGKLNENGVG